jgi:hypothetical protein
MQGDGAVGQGSLQPHQHPPPLSLLAAAVAALFVQDYNRQVITHLTLPNVQANLQQLPAGVVRQHSRYYSGGPCWMQAVVAARPVF